MKVSNFEFGTVQLKKNQATIYIPKNEFKHDSLEELDDIKNDTTSKKFLPLIEIKEDEAKNRIELIYDIPNGFFPFHKIKGEDLIIKLSIAKTIIEDDVLNNNYFVSLHPSTLFYMPMSAVKYTYRANHLMPQENKYTNFDRYKALVLSILSGLSYENCLKNNEHVKKTKNDLINSILEVKSREELLEDLGKLLEYKQYAHFKMKKQDKNKKRFKYIAVVAVSFIVLLLAVGITKSLANKEYAQAVAHYEQEIENIEEENNLQQHLSNEDYEAAAESMKKIGKSNEEIANMFLDAGLYQQALNTEPDYLNKIIDILYEEDLKDTILDLKLEGSEQLETEKQIVSYDYDELKAKQHFIDDENTIFRLGKAFVEHGDMEDARLLQERVKNDDLGKYITLKEKEDELKKNKDSLSKVEEELEKEKDKDKKKDKENQKKTITEKIESLEKEIEEMKKSN